MLSLLDLICFSATSVNLVGHDYEQDGRFLSTNAHKCRTLTHSNQNHLIAIGTHGPEPNTSAAAQWLWLRSCESVRRRLESHELLRAGAPSSVLSSCLIFLEILCPKANQLTIHAPDGYLAPPVIYILSAPTIVNSVHPLSHPAPAFHCPTKIV